MDTPRIAVIGAGLIGRKHVDVVRQFAQLHAIIDPAPATKDLAAQHGALWFETLEAYLAQHSPDGAIVASPNTLHLPQGRACLEAGIPVLIEKPLAESAPNAQALTTLSERLGIAVLVGHHRRHSPLVKKAKSLIDKGTLGRIATVTAQFWLYKPQDYYDATWRTKEGGGPIFINLIHDIDLLRHFCGDITAVQAMENNAVRGFEVEDTAALLLRFKNGALGTVSISDTVAAPWSWELTAGENPAYPKTSQAAYRIGGTDGSLSVPDLQLWQHPDVKSWWAPIENTAHPADPLDPVVEQFKHFMDVIAGRAQPLVPASEGAKNLAVLDAIKQAARHGGTQQV
ncbi:Gfo/Idh/MocA family protein [Algirhabdus cladophorae]|uniref:Gfo/Idh/MocA family protein n=1 Tax=Algirhabdus cladophorae TaxID=3377108 RepID=UPI003B8464F3